MFKKIILASLFSILPVLHSTAYAMSPEYKSIPLEDRQIIYNAQKVEASDIAFSNLLPFAPGSMKIGDSVTVAIVSITDVAAIAYTTMAISSKLNNQPDSDFGLFIGAILVPSLYIFGHGFGFATPWGATQVYNQNLRNKLGVQDPEAKLHQSLNKKSSLTQPLFSYGTSF